MPHVSLAALGRIEGRFDQAFAAASADDSPGALDELALSGILLACSAEAVLTESIGQARAGVRPDCKAVLHAGRQLRRANDALDLIRVRRAEMHENPHA